MQVSPLSGHSHQLPVAILVGLFEQDHCNGSYKITHCYIAWKGVGCEPPEFLIEAHGGCFAFHGLHVEVIQHIKCESSLWANERRWEQVVLEEDHGLIWFVVRNTPAPSHMVIKYACGIHDEQGGLVVCIGPNINGLIHSTVITLVHINPFCISMSIGARLSSMAHMEDEPLVHQRGRDKAIAIPSLYPVEW